MTGHGTPPKPDLVLLHGALGAASQFDALTRDLSAHAKVIALNLPGHGGTPHPGRLDITKMGDAVLAELDACGVQAAHVFGYSMGGYVALDLARRAPQRLRAVFTLATKLAWTPEVAQREARMLDADRLQQKVPAFAAQLQERHAPGDWRELLTLTADLLHRLGAQPPLREGDLQGVNLPVRVAVGDRDATVTLDETIRAYRELPGGELLVLPNVTHPLERVPAARLHAEILGFLQSSRPAPE